MLEKLKSKFKPLSQKNKVLLLGSVLLLIVISSILYISNYREEQRKREARDFVRELYESTERMKKDLLNPEKKYENKGLEDLYRNNMKPNYSPKTRKLNKDKK